MPSAGFPVASPGGSRWQTVSNGQRYVTEDGTIKRGSRGVAVSKPAPVAVALDAPDLETAARWAALVTPHVSTVKVGLELYLRYGPEVVATVRGASRLAVVLDLKLHDIPATVAGAARAVPRLLPSVLTVHAAGGAGSNPAALHAPAP